VNRATLLTGTFFDSLVLGEPWEATPAPETQIALGGFGVCPEGPTCCWLVFDSSGSVSGTAGTDPVARRFDEALLAVEALGKRCRCRQELVAVVHFDCPTSLDLGPTPLSRQGRQRIARSLAIPPDAAGQSLLRRSLETVLDQMVQLPEHEHVLLLATDFQLFDADLDELYETLCGFPGTVHAVALRSPPPQRLLDDPQVVVTHVSPTSPRGAVARAVLAGLATHRS
jgi:hypothetical protein